MSASNKYISETCPVINEFTVDKSQTSYYIKYFETKKYVTSLHDDWEKVKDEFKKLENEVIDIKNGLDSEDLKDKSKEMLMALSLSIGAIDNNMNKLYTSIVSRYKANAETDNWFSATAALYAEYVAAAMLGLNGTGSIKANYDAIQKAQEAYDEAMVEQADSQGMSEADELMALLNQNQTEASSAETLSLDASPEQVEEKKAGLFGRIGATLGTFVSGIAEGVVNVGEVIVDAAAVASTALMTPFTLVADGVGAVTSAITGTEFKSATAELFNDCGTFVSKDYSTDWFDSYYNDTSVGQSLKNNAYGFNVARGAGKIVGEIAAVNGVVGVAGSALSAGTSLGLPGATTLAASPVNPVLPSGSATLALPAYTETTLANATTVIYDVSGLPIFASV